MLPDPFLRSTCNRKQKQHFTFEKRQPDLQQLKPSIITWPFLQFSWWHAATGQWPPGPQWGPPYAAQRGHLGAADPGSVSGFITTTASTREESKARQQQLCQRRTALNSLSRIFHIKHLYSVSQTPNFYSALKTCNCDVCEKPGVWLVGESWRTEGVPQRGFLLERIRLISLRHWFPQDACYQCLNSVLKAEVDFWMFKKARNQSVCACPRSAQLTWLPSERERKVFFLQGKLS